MKKTTAKENILALPDKCFSVLPINGSLIVINVGETGYRPMDEAYAEGKRLYHGVKDNEALADKLNELLGVTPLQREAMENGAMFGWEVPGANVENL